LLIFQKSESERKKSRRETLGRRKLKAIAMASAELIADMQASASSSHGDDESASPFFADMLLDLAEAHDIAETPVRQQRKPVVLSGISPLELEMPIFGNVPENNNNPTSMIVSSSSSLNGGGGIAASTATTTPTTGTDGPATDVLLGGLQLDASLTQQPIPTSSNHSNHNRDAPMNRITSASLNNNNNNNNGSGGASSNARAYNTINGAPQLTPASKRWPRDIPWAVAFCIIVPISLLVPIFASPSTNDSNVQHVWVATATAPRVATVHSLLWAYAATLVLSRLLYRTMGGGDGDDARYWASKVLLATAPVSVSVYICLIVVLYIMTPKAFIFSVIPLWYLARDLWLFRRWKQTASTPGGRQAFFQALTCMTLDILSRSLRRSSFYRVVSSLLLVQLGMVWVWQLAILGALRSQGPIFLCMAIVGGKWATGTVARLLSLIASGGIASWFAQQNAIVEQLQQSNISLPEGDMQPLSMNDDDDDDDDIVNGSSDSSLTIPQALRTADGSAYKSGLVMDDGMDDDYDDEEDDTEALTPTSTTTNPRDFFNASGSTVKNFLFSGLSISFGSVAQCGLVGGLAQFLWSQLRKIDHATQTFRGYHGMNIGTDTSDEHLVVKLLTMANVVARNFVRTRSDMAMSHVAAYQKSYQRAAQDVAALVAESGTLRYVTSCVLVYSPRG
jgi:hypothetical protein